MQIHSYAEEGVIWVREKVHLDGDCVEEGRRLADALLAQGETWPTDAIVLDIPSGMMISAFFIAVLRRVHEVRPEVLDLARKTRWLAPYAFQRQAIAGWMESFQPIVA